MSINNGGLTNLSIGQCADERGISRSNVSINQSNIRQLIDRSSSQANSTLSSFSGAPSVLHNSSVLCRNARLASYIVDLS